MRGHMVDRISDLRHKLKANEGMKRKFSEGEREVG